MHQGVRPPFPCIGAGLPSSTPREPGLLPPCTEAGLSAVPGRWVAPSRRGLAPLHHPGPAVRPCRTRLHRRMIVDMPRGSGPTSSPVPGSGPPGRAAGGATSRPPRRGHEVVTSTARPGVTSHPPAGAPVGLQRRRHHLPPLTCGPRGPACGSGPGRAGASPAGTGRVEVKPDLLVVPFHLEPRDGRGVEVKPDCLLVPFHLDPRDEPAPRPDRPAGSPRDRRQEPGPDWRSASRCWCSRVAGCSDVYAA